MKQYYNSPHPSLEMYYSEDHLNGCLSVEFMSVSSWQLSVGYLCDGQCASGKRLTVSHHISWILLNVPDFR
jgi:hypothetical protein